MNPIITFRQGDILQFNYKNHRDEDSTRTIRFEGLDYGRNDWYPTPGWFMRTWDLDRQQARSFRFENMTTPPVFLQEGPERRLERARSYMNMQTAHSADALLYIEAIGKLVEKYRAQQEGKSEPTFPLRYYPYPAMPIHHRRERFGEDMDD